MAANKVKCNYLWYPKWDSNSQNLDFESSTYTIPSSGHCLVQPVGIEPTSMVLQTTAMTTSAKVAKLVLSPRIKLRPHPYQGRVLSLYYGSIDTLLISLYAVCYGEFSISIYTWFGESVMIRHRRHYEYPVHPLYYLRKLNLKRSVSLIRNHFTHIKQGALG